MTAATAIATCPAWCVSTHDEDDTYHYQDVTAVPVEGGTVNVYAAIDERADRLIVCLEDIEMTPDQARTAAAKLVEAAALAEGR